MIRKAAETDIPALGRIFCEGWQGGYRGILPQDYLDALTPEGCAPRKTPANIWIFEKDGKAVGLIGVGPARMVEYAGMGELRAIYVLPGCWRHGIGRALFTAGCERLREMGFGEFYLWVLRGNVRARAFYEKMGMRPSGEEKADRIGGAEAVEVRYVGTL